MMNNILEQPMILKSINCDGNIEERKYNKVKDFIYQIDNLDGTETNENGWVLPMLDDEIEVVTINGKIIKNSDLKIVNDLYELIKGV